MYELPYGTNQINLFAPKGGHTSAIKIKILFQDERTLRFRRFPPFLPYCNPAVLSNQANTSLSVSNLTSRNFLDSLRGLSLEKNVRVFTWYKLSETVHLNSYSLPSVIYCRVLNIISHRILRSDILRPACSATCLHIRSTGFLDMFTVTMKNYINL